MKVAVFGFGNQSYYRDVINMESLLGGEPPFGGARMAMEFAQAGYEVVLSDPHISTIDASLIEKVKAAGVELTTDDAVAAKDAEVAILFTPFRSGISMKIAERIIPHLGKGAVICTTCTMPVLVFEVAVKKTLFMEDREDIGFSTMHPAAVPGTPKHKHYFIATNELLEDHIVEPEQIEKLKKLAQDTGKTPYLIPAELVSAMGDMGVVATSAAFASALEYYAVSRKYLKTTKEMTEFQLAQAFQVMASIIAKYGLEGLVKFINSEALKVSLSSMLYDEKIQKVAFSSMEALENIRAISEDLPEKTKIFTKYEPTFLSAPSPMLISYIEELAGEDVAKGIIREALRKLYEGNKS
ncbi:H(2)-dependent methylenetetrahydromethanopterin dehydrogenase-related protein [Desulfurobacterium atlanticum]|uniref:H2-forming N(5),N(10)-methenyltetrahydromethanopterin dehydrogenase-related protein n=1 Tax=Desulfurobacterium atlanticum TaxID=240169 RepID=A0A238XTA9_9BACT|nr:H(2)-dependent methylenetetrahydromethanopterin dehydrogenase-related protein [Desulfurobacterium atlanticum]SNR61808.1 H2-forming N(5),N(10)-methenyltetrahydromethanopterin dehydrogenase-related protein [Desulfurobacterium atlanticum]